MVKMQVQQRSPVYYNFKSWITFNHSLKQNSPFDLVIHVPLFLCTSQIPWSIDHYFSNHSVTTARYNKIRLCGSKPRCVLHFYLPSKQHQIGTKATPTQDANSNCSLVIRCEISPNGIFKQNPSTVEFCLLLCEKTNRPWIGREELKQEQEKKYSIYTY